MSSWDTILSKATRLASGSQTPEVERLRLAIVNYEETPSSTNVDIMMDAMDLVRDNQTKVNKANLL